MANSKGRNDMGRLAQSAIEAHSLLVLTAALPACCTQRSAGREWTGNTLHVQQGVTSQHRQVLSVDEHCNDGEEEKRQ